MYSGEILKSKIQSYNGKIDTNFRNNKISKEGLRCICLSVILTDSTYRKDKEYYPQAFLEECKYVAVGKKMSKLVTLCKRPKIDTCEML